ncbi:hypothetical protein LP7551_03869 [Roseibium album]|nr:hypothetical protein LP7551_03869 [Roseibium album]
MISAPLFAALSIRSLVAITFVANLTFCGAGRVSKARANDDPEISLRLAHFIPATGGAVRSMVGQ